MMPRLYKLLMRFEAYPGIRGRNFHGVFLSLMPLLPPSNRIMEKRKSDFQLRRQPADVHFRMTSFLSKNVFNLHYL